MLRFEIIEYIQSQTIAFSSVLFFEIFYHLDSTKKVLHK